MPEVHDLRRGPMDASLDLGLDVSEAGAAGFGAVEAAAARGAAVELAQQYSAALRQTQRTAHLTVQISAKE